MPWHQNQWCCPTRYKLIMFKITKMTVDGNNDVVSLNWCYTGADGYVNDTFTLLTPAGNVALAEVTETVALGWLNDQMETTAAQLDQYLANKKATETYQEELCDYVPNEQGVFAKYEIVEEEEDFTPPPELGYL